MVGLGQATAELIPPIFMMKMLAAESVTLPRFAARSYADKLPKGSDSGVGVVTAAKGSTAENTKPFYVAILTAFYALHRRGSTASEQPQPATPMAADSCRRSPGWWRGSRPSHRRVKHRTRQSTSVGS
jgi:hypothetical protein